MKTQERPTTKKCSKCSDVKVLNEFPKKGAVCIICSRALFFIYRENNKEKVNGRIAKYRQTEEGRAKKVIADSKWRQENPERKKENDAKWRLENRERMLECMKIYSPKRRKAQKMQTPIWADLKLIAGIYKEASVKTTETGIPHEVDHFYPIKGKKVSGLHCETNLRIVTKAENKAKGCKMVDDIV